MTRNEHIHALRAQKWTLKRIGEKFGMSDVRVRQILQGEDYRAKHRELMREYQQRPDVKVKHREYRQRPDVKARNSVTLYAREQAAAEGVHPNDILKRMGEPLLHSKAES